MNEYFENLISIIIFSQKKVFTFYVSYALVV